MRLVLEGPNDDAGQRLYTVVTDSDLPVLGLIIERGVITVIAWPDGENYVDLGDVVPIGARFTVCDVCGDESNSEPGLLCGRRDQDEDGRDMGDPCTGTYRVPVRVPSVPPTYRAAHDDPSAPGPSDPLR